MRVAHHRGAWNPVPVIGDGAYRYTKAVDHPAIADYQSTPK
ncbi:hypothetical protein [Nocardia nepalensis]